MTDDITTDSGKGMPYVTAVEKNTPTIKEVVLKWGNFERAKPILNLLPVS